MNPVKLLLISAIVIFCLGMNLNSMAQSPGFKISTKRSAISPNVLPSSRSLPRELTAPEFDCPDDFGNKTRHVRIKEDRKVIREEEKTEALYEEQEETIQEKKIKTDSANDATTFKREATHKADEVINTSALTKKERRTLQKDKEAEKEVDQENEKHDACKITYKDPAGVYITPEIILYNNLQFRRCELQSELSCYNKVLYNSSLEFDKSKRRPDEVVDANIVTMRLLQEQINDAKAKQDSLYYIYVKDYVNFRKAIFLGFGPNRSRAFFDILYDNEGKIVRILNNTGFNLGSKTASLYAELASGTLSVFRISLGTMVVSSSEEDTEEARREEAFQKLASSGGNTVLNIEYPLAYIHSPNKQYNVVSRLIAKGTADFPDFGTTTDSFAASASLGVDFYADAALRNNALRFFINVNFNKIKGSDVYKENLGVSNSAFYYGQLVAGVIVAERFKLSFVLNTFGSQEILRNSRIIAGGQILHQ
jgi:hypothetical protein